MYFIKENDSIGSPQYGGLHALITPPAGAMGPVYAHLWYLQDHLGNIRVLADGGGNAVAMHDFDPFGEEIELGSTRLPYPFPPGGTESPYKYGGKEWNTTTSTYDFEARQLSPSFHRFTTMDPLCEKYYGISPYAYCARNPVNLVDPEGKHIRIIYIENGQRKAFRYTGKETRIPNNSYVKSVIEAYQYNKRNWENAGYTEECPSSLLVERGDFVVNVESRDDQESNYHRENGGIPYLIWNPTEGSKTDRGIVLSPATVFVHEADHAFDDMTNAKNHSDRKAKTRSDGYTNDEEYRVITGSEQRAARANGEIKGDQVTRNNHNGETVQTKGVASTVVEKEKQKRP